MTTKTAYQRPYKTRSQRRESARRKYDEAKDHKFLWRVAAGIGLFVLVVLGFAVKGVAERTDAAASQPLVEAFR